MYISVVIPVRNDAAMLDVALQALEKQTRLPDEIVIVDNGSTDGSASLAREAGCRVISVPVRGIPRASAAGYDAARGELIARIDADTVVPPGWLAQGIAAFERDPSLSVLTGGAEFYGASERVHNLGRSLYIGGMYWSMTAYLGHPPIFGSNFMMRQGVWQELRDEVHRDVVAIHDDLDLSLHIKPWMRVALDRDWSVAISARPFASASALARRVSWVAPTLRNHWPDQAPWARRAQWRRWADEHPQNDHPERRAG